jgi:myo-inositol-1(or 4)-monophosphatase
MEILLGQICQQSIELIRETGAFIQNQRAGFDINIVETKGLRDFVSYVDKESEQKLVSGFKKILPGSGFVAEENSAGNSDEDYIWFIDPLDGTTNFIHGITPFAISVGLQHKGKMIMGIVLELGQNELFWSYTGKPVFCNDKPVQVSKAGGVNQGLISTGFPINNFERLPNHISAVSQVIQNSHGVRRHGSAATDLAYIAAGRFDGFFEYGLSPWDVAAGAFLVEQAGGKTSDYRGKDNFLYGREMLAGAPAVYDELLVILQKAMYNE